MFVCRDLRNKPTADPSERTCNICSKVLLHRHSLTGHMRLCHNNDGQICPICGKTFKDLPKHTKRYHSNPNPAKKCTWEGCDKAFMFEQGLKTHIDCFHKNIRTQCDLCGQWVKSMYDHKARKHKLGKSRECSQVGAVTLSV